MMTTETKPTASSLLTDLIIDTCCLLAEAVSVGPSFSASSSWHRTG